MNEETCSAPCHFHIDQWLLEIASFRIKRRNAGGVSNVHTPPRKNRVSQWFAGSSLKSTLSFAAVLDIPHKMLWKVDRSVEKHTFCMQKAQPLADVDYPLQKSQYSGCLIQHRMIHSFLPLFCIQMKSSLSINAWSIRTMHICGLPKIATLWLTRSTQVQY